MKHFVIFIMALLLLVPTFSNAESNDANDKELTINKNAAIAGAATATATVIGAGALATTASAATLTSTIAAVGMGSMAAGIGVVAAIPILVGGGVYVTYSWLSSDKDKEASKSE